MGGGGAEGGCVPFPHTVPYGMVFQLAVPELAPF